MSVVTILILVLLLSCTDDDDPISTPPVDPSMDVNSRSLLQHVTEYYDGRLSISHDLYYNSAERLDSISIESDPTQINSAKIVFEGDQVSKIINVLLRDGRVIKYDY